MRSGRGRRNDASGEVCSLLCMTVIGIGYLFPISAVWAAFDYWKVLFPDENVEFAVTSVYQVGSVATVAVLSMGRSMSMGPRILGGFAGQFLCLAVIFAFRWIALPAMELYRFLLAVVAGCSVATGYLDSALLALCSQYSPKMQQHLQIGIGFGTLVSVLYRDCTKLLLRGDVADATSAYFAVALLTVLVCVSCYELLMTLPVSRHINDGSDKYRKLIETEGGAGAPDDDEYDEREYRRSPSLGATFTPVFQEELLEESLRVSPKFKQARHNLDGTGDVAEPGEEASFAVVWSQVWMNQFVIFLNLFLTTLCYPGIITSIPCRQFTALQSEHWFQTLLLTAFTFADIVARFMTHRRCGLTHANVYLTVVVRLFVFPLVLYCTASDKASDSLAFAVVAVFGFLNGYCVSMALIVVNDIPRMTDEQRKTCGRISACSVNSGLCLGSIVAAWMATHFGLYSG